ncbi:hypothetical protein DFP72DRAFT_860966 [Ephemerocybe angulata]|uniref:Uncharacterized protein n=1 Tax=Ephemerocybe angulata TaxID=980116 RepID=A0A8H6LU01_9AGAR|nr:hypothetical protein DFP72DRAFT_860966 [Tulosesus angulatus]
MDAVTPNAAVDLTSTHALRNPLKDIIPPRQNPKKPLGPGEDPVAVKNATALRRNETRKAAELLKAALDNLQEQQKLALEKIAEEHGRKFEHVETMFKRASLYSKKRRPNLQNALIHAKAKELNTAIEEDEEMQDLTPEQEEEYIQKLEEHRTLKQRGARANNKAATLDATAVMARVHEEVSTIIGDKLFPIPLGCSCLTVCGSLTVSLIVLDRLPSVFLREPTSTTPSSPDGPVDIGSNFFKHPCLEHRARLNGSFKRV